jgi:hypothetical protein
MTGYYLNVSDAGEWSLEVIETDGTGTTLASGQLPQGFGTGVWHRLALRFSGDQITATIDGSPLTTVTDTSFANGQTGLLLDSYINADFDDWSVTPN